MKRQDWTESTYKQGPLILYFVIRLQNSIFLLNFLLFKWCRGLDINGRRKLRKQLSEWKLSGSQPVLWVFCPWALCVLWVIKDKGRRKAELCPRGPQSARPGNAILRDGFQWLEWERGYCVNNTRGYCLWIWTYQHHCRVGPLLLLALAMGDLTGSKTLLPLRWCLSSPMISPLSMLGAERHLLGPGGGNCRWKIHLRAMSWKRWHEWIIMLEIWGHFFQDRIFPPPHLGVGISGCCEGVLRHILFNQSHLTCAKRGGD